MGLTRGEVCFVVYSGLRRNLGKAIKRVLKSQVLKPITSCLRRLVMCYQLSWYIVAARVKIKMHHAYRTLTSSIACKDFKHFLGLRYLPAIGKDATALVITA